MLKIIKSQLGGRIAHFRRKNGKFWTHLCRVEDSPILFPFIRVLLNYISSQNFLLSRRTRKQYSVVLPVKSKRDH